MKVLFTTMIIALVFSAATNAEQGSLAPQDLKKLKITSFIPPEKAPKVTLQNLDGEAARLSDYRGNPLMLYFWATW